MKTFAIIVIAVCSIMALTPQAQAQEDIRAVQPRLVSPKPESPEEQLLPWLSLCQRRIHRLLEKEHLAPFSCTFNLDDGGQVCALKILKPSGSDTFDKAVLSAVKSASLQPPQGSRLAFVQSRGLKLEIVDAQKVKIRLAPHTMQKLPNNSPSHT